MEIQLVNDDHGDEQIPYDEAVVRGRNFVLAMKDSQFELGQLADRLEPKYGDENLGRYAEEIGIDHGTLKSYRATYRAWKDEPVCPSYSVARALNPHPRKADIIQETPELTVKEAEAKVEQWRTESSAAKERKPSKRRKPNKLLILQEINDFLSHTNELTAMIWEFTDDPPHVDPSDQEDIVEALRAASDRIDTTIRAFPRPQSDTALEESEEQEAEAILN
jgi:hypothetical protein